MPQALTGKKKSIPKVVRVNADDNVCVLYKNLGNGRRIPFFGGTTVTLASGTQEVTVSSGVEFSEFKVSEGIIQFSPVFTVTSGVSYDTGLLGKAYIEKDTTNNIVKLKTTASVTQDTEWDIYVFLGDAANMNDSTRTNQIWKNQVNYQG
jgi:hypothetical protein